jgi:hypothetical protein
MSIMVVGGIKSLPSLRWIAMFVRTYGHTGNEITRQICQQSRILVNARKSELAN